MRRVFSVLHLCLSAQRSLLILCLGEPFVTSRIDQKPQHLESRPKHRCQLQIGFKANFFRKRNWEADSIGVFLTKLTCFIMRQL